MRITFLLTVGIERPSGVRYFQIARELVRRGHQVRLLALHPDLRSCTQRRFVSDGVEVWYVGQMHARKAGSQPERFSALELLQVLVRSTLGMLRGILCSPAERYHLGKPQPINGLAALLGVLLLRRRRFYLDCDDDEVQSNRLSAGWQRAVFGFWQWLLPRLAAGVTVNSSYLAERMRRSRVRALAYVPNGVDLAAFKPPPARLVEGLRAALGLQGRPVVAYAGALALQNHAVDLLLDAFAQLHVALPSAVLLLIGGGEDLPLLRRRAAELGLAEHVRFTGQLQRQAVPALLALADVSVDPVRDDAVARARSPLKIFESLALGVPVVTGAVGDRAALLDDGAAGVLVPAGDPTALAQALQTVLGDAGRRAALRHSGRQHVQRYRWEVLAERWESIYNHPDS